MIKILKRLEIIASIGILIFIIISFSFLSLNEQLEKKYLSHKNEIAELILIQKNISNFIDKKVETIVFDKINIQLNKFESKLKFLIEDVEGLPVADEYLTTIVKLKQEFENEKIIVERLKSDKAVEVNSVSFLVDTSSNEYIGLSTSDKNIIDLLRIEVLASVLFPERKSPNDVKTNLAFTKNGTFMNNFLNQIEILRNNTQKRNENIADFKKIEIEKYLDLAEQSLKKSYELSEKLSSIMYYILLAILGLGTISLTIMARKLSQTKDNLRAFRMAVENSDNVVVITDVNRNITFANEAFEKVSGYRREEAIGQNPRILNSGIQSKEFYIEMNTLLDQGKKWSGRFINKNANGVIFYEDASITPMFDEDDKLVGYLAIKLDITDSILQAEELANINQNLEHMVEAGIEKSKQKDILLMQQSKLAAMGGMMANIAHQWRQPLTAISASAGNLQMHEDFGFLNESERRESIESIISNTQYLSETIENFRNFFSPNKKEEEKTMYEIFELVKIVFGNTLSNSNIKLIQNIQEFEIKSYVGELSQVIINLIKNSKDAISENGVIFVDCFKENENAVVKVRDSGGGISDDIADKIYEPYFTTKHQSIGTGLGLHMSYTIIKEHLGGEINFENVEYEYDGISLKGAEFTIKIPINNEKKIQKD